MVQILMVPKIWAAPQFYAPPDEADQLPYNRATITGTAALLVGQAWQTRHPPRMAARPG